jgi:hypothetical protein
MINNVYWSYEGYGFIMVVESPGIRKNGYPSAGVKMRG